MKATHILGVLIVIALLGYAGYMMMGSSGKDAADYLVEEWNLEEEDKIDRQVALSIIADNKKVVEHVVWNWGRYDMYYYARTSSASCEGFYDVYKENRAFLGDDYYNYRIFLSEDPDEECHGLEESTPELRQCWDDYDKDELDEECEDVRKDTDEDCSTMGGMLKYRCEAVEKRDFDGPLGDLIQDYAYVNLAHENQKTSVCAFVKDDYLKGICNSPAQGDAIGDDVMAESLPGY